MSENSKNRSIHVMQQIARRVFTSLPHTGYLSAYYNYMLVKNSLHRPMPFNVCTCIAYLWWQSSQSACKSEWSLNGVLEITETTPR